VQRRDPLRVLLLARPLRLPPDAVDGLASGGRQQPRARPVGQALAPPPFERGDVRLLQRVLGEIEVADAEDERCEDLTRLAPEDPVERRVGQGRASARTRAGAP